MLVIILIISFPSILTGLFPSLNKFIPLITRHQAKANRAFILLQPQVKRKMYLCTRQKATREPIVLRPNRTVCNIFDVDLRRVGRVKAEPFACEGLNPWRLVSHQSSPGGVRDDDRTVPPFPVNSNKNFRSVTGVTYVTCISEVLTRVT